MTVNKLLETARTLKLAEKQASRIKKYQFQCKQNTPKRNQDKELISGNQCGIQCGIQNRKQMVLIDRVLNVSTVVANTPTKQNVQYTNKSVITVDEKITSLLIVNQNPSLRKNMSNKSRTVIRMMDTNSASGTTLQQNSQCQMLR